MGPSATANPTSNYVTLGVGDEIFAVDVAIVREILAYRTVAHLRLGRANGDGRRWRPINVDTVLMPAPTADYRLSLAMNFFNN